MKKLSKFIASLLLGFCLSFFLLKCNNSKTLELEMCNQIIPIQYFEKTEVNPRRDSTEYLKIFSDTDSLFNACMGNFKMSIKLGASLHTFKPIQARGIERYYLKIPKKLFRKSDCTMSIKSESDHFELDIEIPDRDYEFLRINFINREIFIVYSNFSLVGV